MLKKNLFLFFLIVLAIIPRFIFLDRVPASVNSDELQYAVNSQSFLFSGKDTSGTVNPIDVLMFRYPAGFIQAELSYFIDAPFLGLFGTSLFNLEFPYALLSVLSIPLIYLITRKLFDEKTAVVAGLLSIINPYLIFLGRSAYEMGNAIFFFLFVFYGLLIAKGWKILLVFPLALLGFYSYIGTKLIFIPFMFIVILYAYLLNNKKYLKQYLLLFSLCVVFTIFFIFRIGVGGGRTSEIVTPNNPNIIQKVEDLRKTTIRTPLMNLYENKYFVYSEVLVKNFFNVFSPTYLFSGSDYFYLLGIHGILYYIDFIFLGLGAAFLLFLKKRQFVLLGLLILISSLPEVFHNPTGSGVFSSHISLMLPFLIMVISFGISYSLGRVKNKRNLEIFSGLIALVYFILFLNFTNSYLFRFPMQNGTFPIQNRILSKYISLTSDPVVVYSSNPIEAFKEYIFYRNLYSPKTKSEIDKALNSGNYVMENVSIKDCGQRPAVPQKNLIIDDSDCGRKIEGSLAIAQLSDSGARYYIYNDKLCSKYNLPHFISNVSVSDLNVEGLSPKSFCEKFIVSY